MTDLQEVSPVVQHPEDVGRVNPTLEFFKNSSNTPTVTVATPPSMVQVKHFQQLTDDFEPFEFDWIIENIFDRGRLHMIAGPQGSGKTRFFLRMIYDWSHGIPVLNQAVSPSKFVYIDTTRDKKSIKAALRSLGIAPSEFNIIDWNKDHTSSSVNDLQKMIPDDIEVVFIDNLAMMIQSETHGDPASSPSAVFRFLSKLKTWMNKTNRTVIFTHTCIKAEQAHRYMSPKSKVYGTQAWMQNVETAILFDEENPADLRDPYRLLDIIVKNHVSYNLPRRYKLQNDGRLTVAPVMPSIETGLPSDDSYEDAAHIRLLEFFPLDGGEIDAVKLCKKTNLATTTLYRHLKKLMKLGMIEKKDKSYIRIQKISGL
jgi:KaiC/GvpD/RAD55 family RecA-like ATPase